MSPERLRTACGPSEDRLQTVRRPSADRLLITAGSVRGDNLPTAAKSQDISFGLPVRDQNQERHDYCAPWHHQRIFRSTADLVVRMSPECPQTALRQSPDRLLAVFGPSASRPLTSSEPSTTHHSQTAHRRSVTSLSLKYKISGS